MFGLRKAGVLIYWAKGGEFGALRRQFPNVHRGWVPDVRGPRQETDREYCDRLKLFAVERCAATAAKVAKVHQVAEPEPPRPAVAASPPEPSVQTAADRETILILRATIERLEAALDVRDRASVRDKDTIKKLRDQLSLTEDRRTHPRAEAPGPKEAADIGGLLRSLQHSSDMLVREQTERRRDQQTIEDLRRQLAVAIDERQTVFSQLMMLMGGAQPVPPRDNRGVGPIEAERQGNVLHPVQWHSASPNRENENQSGGARRHVG
jgi:hypothetical protein